MMLWNFPATSFSAATLVGRILEVSDGRCRVPWVSAILVGVPDHPVGIGGDARGGHSIQVSHLEHRQRRHRRIEMYRLGGKTITGETCTQPVCFYT